VPMASKDRPLSRIELLQGTLDLIILQTLRWGPRHGYGIAQLIRAGSRDALQVDTGSLYPALHRLERQRFIAAEWETSENKQRVRIYRLTPRGRKQLAAERSRWEQISDAIAGLMKPLPEAEP
jgi:PadR family transcriptional regulator PadR